MAGHSFRGPDHFPIDQMRPLPGRHCAGHISERLPHGRDALLLSQILRTASSRPHRAAQPGIPPRGRTDAPPDRWSGRHVPYYDSGTQLQWREGRANGWLGVCPQYAWGHRRLSCGRLLASSGIRLAKDIAGRHRPQQPAWLGCNPGRYAPAFSAISRGAPGRRAAVLCKSVLFHSPLGPCSHVLQCFSLHSRLRRTDAGSLSGTRPKDRRRNTHVQRRPDLHDHNLSQPGSHQSARQRQTRRIHSVRFESPQ